MVDVETGSGGESQVFKLFGTVIVADERRQRKRSQAGAEEETAAARGAPALPCPRCRSRETKFCYFNNYNVNQPRHFCKACHRYWTAGGALRNVPVGAGRRRSRPSLRAGGSTVSSEGGCGDFVSQVERWLLHREQPPAPETN